ncbi:MAG: EAL domain-containing protein [Desulfuromonadaceae bacterium]|nr:EAL domain-containing protein [Desulfuromonadaceae bacterium]MDD2847922.1 EAL domain-containing protein [Desulfuromonadaceae bacterium]MDD4131336.1 EAL domain-containing protein [Desulfuromonadaceae bacterium]
MELSQSDRRGYRMLYVEDDAEARTLLARMITKKYPDMTLFVAESGGEGVAMFREQRPDIVLTDMNMPVMDGIQLAREIKALDADVAIIAVTALSDSYYLKNAIEIGIRNYISKPVVVKDFFAVIEKTIEEIALKRLVCDQDRRMRSREQQLVMAQKIAHLGSWEWDVGSGKTSWSDELYRIFGLEPASIPASYKGFLERVHPDDRTTVKNAVQHAVKNRQSIISHYCRIVRPDSSVRTIHGQGEVVFDDTGKLVSVIGTSHDVTERRQMEEERARLAMIVESSSDAIFSLSADGIITSWNGGAENVFGYSADEIVGRPVFTIIPPERYDERSRILQTIMGGEKVQLFETTRIRKDGSEIYVSITTSPLRDAEGKIIGNSVIARDVTERRKLEEIIEHQAHHDSLTDLPNRQLFMDFLSLELAQARRDETKLALLFLDLNGFKQVNDTLGHSCGDRLLQEVGQRLKGCVRESDTVARLGGDEFTVLMPALGRTDDVSIVLEKILGVFEKPFVLDDVVVDATTSIGICMFPDDGDCGEELMKKADIAMYDAKGSGRNSYQFYNAEINSRTIKRQRMEKFLRKAVGKGELELLFQPVVCSDTRCIIGAEALLRWRHPEQGLLAPDQFLAIAETSGIIVPMGEWVIRNACHQARIWNDKGYPLSVSVNLSNRQFHQSNLVEKTASILAETGLPPCQLEFDITEKTIMADVDFSLRNMQALTEMGVTLAIDNFGCGSSSLHWIKKMQTNKVKIDKSFVTNMMCEPDELAVVNAVIAMSHNLEVKVVASGVETEEQLSVIRQSGCDQLQGYVISKPLLPDEFVQMVVNA